MVVNAGMPSSVVDSLRLAAEAQEHEKAAQITQAIALLNAAELYRVGRQEAEDARDAFLEAWPGRHLEMPGIGEHFALEVGALLGLAPHEAMDRLISIQSLATRLPFVWEAFCEGEVWWWQARNIELATRKLGLDAAQHVDRMIATAARMLTWSQIAHRLEQYIKEADPELAREEALARAENRYVTIEPLWNGSSDIHGRLSPRDAVDLEQAISARAALLPTPDLPAHADGTSLTGERATTYRRNTKRALALGELARESFGQDTLPTAEMVVHIDANDPVLHSNSEGTGVATVERWGTLLSEELPKFLANSKVTVRPVVDIRSLPPSNLHDPTPTMRFAIQQRNPVDVFPYGTLRSASCDLDHTIPYTVDGPDGQTSCGNLGPLSRRTHRAKTFGGFRLSQPEPGVFHWRTPLGWEYVVTNLGTVRIAEPPPRPAPPEPPRGWDDGHVEPPEPPEPPSVAQRVLPGLQNFLFAFAP